MRVVVHGDSQVITNQVNGDYECKGKRMKKYLDQVKARIDDLEAKIVQIPKGENERADRLAKAASAEHMVIPGNVLSFVQLSSLIDPSNVQEICSDSSWTAPLVSYLKDGVLPDGKEAARKLKVQAARFILIKDVLYKRGFSRPYLRCLGTEEADYVMREVTKEFAETIQGLGHWYTSLYERGTIGPPCRKMPKPMLGIVTSAKGSATLLDNQPKS